MRRCLVYAIQILLLILFTTRTGRSQVFADELAGWSRIDSTTRVEKELRELGGERFDLASEYGLLSLTEARYRIADTVLEVSLYRMVSTVGAFGFFSVSIPAAPFTGQIGNGILETDSNLHVNYGAYYVRMTRRSGETVQPPPLSFLYALHDRLIRSAELEVVRTPLPIGERQFGSERFYAGPRSWEAVRDTLLRRLLPLLRSVNAFCADYVKERLGIRRRVLAPSNIEESDRGSFLASARHLLRVAVRPGRTDSGVEEFLGESEKILLVSSSKGLYLVVAATDDPGVFEWLVTEFGI